MITFDASFDAPLPTLNGYNNCWAIIFYPETQKVDLIGHQWDEHINNAIRNCTAYELLSLKMDLADASAIREYLQKDESVSILQELTDGYSAVGDDSGAVSSSAYDELWALREKMTEDLTKDDLPTYWKASDWFQSDPPTPDYRDAQVLIEDAKAEGAYLDKDDVQQYLNDLVTHGR